MCIVVLFINISPLKALSFRLGVVYALIFEYWEVFGPNNILQSPNFIPVLSRIITEGWMEDITQPTAKMLPNSDGLSLMIMKSRTSLHPL